MARLEISSLLAEAREAYDTDPVKHAVAEMVKSVLIQVHRDETGVGLSRGEQRMVTTAAALTASLMERVGSKPEATTEAPSPKPKPKTKTTTPRPRASLARAGQWN